MNTNSFSFRDQSIAKVNMAMNYLGRVVRENMVLFDFDARTETASFLTESNLLVNCVVDVKNGNVSLHDIEVNEATKLFSDESIDGKVNESVSAFISSLRNDEYGDAENSFSTLLDAFEGRSKINDMREKLERRSSCFGESQNILESAEFVKLQEIKDKVIDYVKENQDTILEFEDVSNSLKLSNALGKAFNTPRRTWEDIVSEGTVAIPHDSQKTVFEMVCSQELIRNELNESKENFARSWVKNEQVAKLASCIYNDDALVLESLNAAVADVPYLALASKSDLKTVFASIYEASDVVNISQKDIREYVARIFEFKKPIKQRILSELNESYGINVQNLKFVPTFSNLAKAQSVFFEALASLSEKESVVRDVFEAFAKSLRKRGGIQTLDVNDFIFEVFSDAELKINETLFSEMDLDAIVESILEKKDLPGNQEAIDSDGDGKIEASDLKALRSKKKKKKGDDEEDMNKRADEAVDPGEEAEESPEEEEEEEEGDGAGLGDQDMTELMGELEELFKDIDWDALSQASEEEEDAPEEA